MAVIMLFVTLISAGGWESLQPVSAASGSPQSRLVSNGAQIQTSDKAKVADAQPKIDPGKEAEIRRLLDLNNSKKNLLDSMQWNGKNFQSTLINILPPGDYRQKLVELFYAKCQSKMAPERLVDMSIPVYDKYFSREEIEFLIKLYETPAGEKSVAVVPQTAKEIFDKAAEGSGTFRLGFIKKILAEHPDMAEGLGLQAKPDKRKSSFPPADTGIGPAKIDPAEEAKIRHFLDISGSMKALPDLQLPVQMVKNNPSSPFPDTKYRAQLTDLYLTYVSQNSADYMLGIVISVFHKYFSPEEIQELIEFYETPTGKKIAGVTPEFTKELSERIQKWGVEVAQISLQEVLVEHPDLAEAFEKAVNGAQK